MKASVVSITYIGAQGAVHNMDEVLHVCMRVTVVCSLHHAGPKVLREPWVR